VEPPCAEDFSIGGSTRRLLELAPRGVTYLGPGAVVRTAVVVDLDDVRPVSGQGYVLYYVRGKSRLSAVFS